MAAVNKRILQPGERIRVMVVDHAVAIRRLVAEALEEDPSIEAVGTAPNGTVALQRIPQLQPDVITLDIEMPGMDGFAVLRQIRREHPQVRMIVYSAITERGAAATREVLRLGADDYVTKAPEAGSSGDPAVRLRGELVPKIRQFFQMPEDGPSEIPSGELLNRSTQGQAPERQSVRPRVVVIGVSTGGPDALNSILPELPAAFPLPVLIVQHMPPGFTRQLAEHLHSACSLSVAEATSGQQVVAGGILIAPGDFHMKVVEEEGGVRIRLDQSPPLNSCRPAVDALFASVGEVYGGAAIAVILTGMGHDGLRGAKILKARGATVFAQDEASSVVWGMPGAVVNAGVADRVLPLDQVVPEIVRLVGRVW